MKTTKNLNDKKQANTKAKLLKVNAQLNNLDKEINSIQNELNLSRSLSADNLLNDVTIFQEKRKGFRLYKESVEVMNKRAQNKINEEESIDFIPQSKTKIQIKGYKPPSERIFDVNERKMKLIKQIQKENEEKIAENCTFRPQINQVSNEIEYDPKHLIQPKKKQNFDNSKKNKNKKRENFEDHGIGIYERQIKKNIYHQPEKIKDNVISPKSEKNMIERLTKPKEQPSIQQENEKEPKNYASKQGTNRLVAQSIRRFQHPTEPEEKPKQLMNKKSKEIIRNKKVDLFEEYLDAKDRVRQKNAEIIEWRKLTERNENKNHEQVKFKKIRTDQNPEVAGMDDFIDRMKSRPVKKEVRYKVHPGIIVARPFNFELRDEMKKNTKTIEEDFFQDEISDILSKI